MLEFQVTKGQGLCRTDKNIVSADATDIQAHFTLTADFSGTITAWWRRSDKPGSTWTSTLSNGQCTIPAEALSATDKAVYGPHDHFVYVSISDTGRTTSEECEIRVQRSAFSTTATPGTGGSPTAYEELVEQFDELKEENQQFKTDMTEQQTEFESTVTENVDNIRYIVETETAPPIIDEASGAEITLEDSAYRQVRDLQLYGYSKQVKTTGAQLIPLIEDNFINNQGLTCALNPDGSLNISGIPIAQYTRVLNVNLNLQPGDYYISGGSKAAGDMCTAAIINGTYYIDNNTFTIASGDTVRIEISYYNSNLQTVNLPSYKPMLNAGTSALPWEPYSGGVASPSPDWAQPIHSVADNVTVESQGANLIEFGPNQNSVTSNGITFKNLKDGKILVTGTCTADSYVSFLVATQSQLNLVNGTYFLSGCPAGGSWSTFYIQMNDAAASGRLVLDMGNGSSFDFASEGKSYGVFIVIRSGYTCNNLVFKPMLNRGTSPLPWQPYVAPSSALITLTDSLRGIPVTSGGNYTDDDGQQWIADYIYRRVTDGKWMLWRNCGRLECDGSEDENWSVNGNRMIVNLGVLFPDARRFVLCNRGVFSASGSEIGASFIYNRYFYYTPYPQYLAVNEFKTWLQTNPLDVVYQLLSPTVEELPDDVQTELNGLMTYNLHTDMWNDDGAFMNLKYVADTKTWINNKIAGLSTAMLNQN